MQIKFFKSSQQHCIDTAADPNRFQRGDTIRIEHLGQLVELCIAEKTVPLDESESVVLECFVRASGGDESE